MIDTPNDDKFKKWGGVAPTELRWNADRTRAYGRGAADDLSGVVAIGMAIDATLKAIGYDSENPLAEKLQALPCNIKIALNLLGHIFVLHESISQFF